MFAAAQTRRRQHPIVNELCLPHPTQLPDDARAGAWLRVRTTCTVILPRLKQATFARHAAIKSPSVLLAPGLSRATCRGSLRRFWGYCAPSVSRPKNWNRPDVPRAVRPAPPGAAVRLSGCDRRRHAGWPGRHAAPAGQSGADTAVRRRILQRLCRAQGFAPEVPSACT